MDSGKFNGLYIDVALWIVGVWILAVLCLSGIFLLEVPEAPPQKSGFEAAMNYLASLEKYLWQYELWVVWTPFVPATIVLLCAIFSTSGLLDAAGAFALSAAVVIFPLFFAHDWAVSGGIESITPPVSATQACDQAAGALVDESGNGGDALGMVESYRAYCPDGVLAEAIDRSALEDGHPLRSLELGEPGT